MGNVRAHALVIGYRKEDVRRFTEKFPPATIDAGPCIADCGRHVFFNASGISAVRDRDADVCCLQCEYQFAADINRSMVES